jgi:hypothetical protein
MSLPRSCLLLAAVLGFGPPAAAAEDAPRWKAGVAARTITPDEPMWLAGYGNRDRASEGKLTELYVKALALEDPAGGRFVLLTADLVGVSRRLSEAVAEDVRRRTGLPRERLMLAVSHTHCGPVIDDNLAGMYAMPAAYARKVGPYTERVRAAMADVVGRALAGLAPARLAVGKGTARFAVNRRRPTPEGFVNAANPDGPVDHDVPVLRVEGPDGALRAAVFGYACHNTTMQFYLWSGDYAGLAQAYLEEKHPGAVALFWAGCGGDANPLPRSKVELLRKYGRELADAVEAVLAGPMTPVTGTLAARYRTVSLPYAELPDKARVGAELHGRSPAERHRAELLSRQLAERGKLDDAYPSYPVQAVRLGGQVTWVALGGEAVVDYTLRLKRELAGPRAVWVTAYANDVIAYIPSERVLAEGGYEGGASMVYYGLPSKWAPGVEEKIVRTVRALVKEVDGAP